MAFRRTKISSRRSAVGVSQFLITPATNESPLALDQQAHVISSNENRAETMLCFFFCLDAEMRLGGAGKSTTSLSLAMLKTSAGNARDAGYSPSVAVNSYFPAGTSYHALPSAW